MQDLKRIDCFGIGQPILVYLTDCLDEKDLSLTWENISFTIAQENQLKAIDEFERWNFYIFFVVRNKSEIDRMLKHKIEHNTISSRKIVVSEDEAKDGINGLIDKYISYKIKKEKRKEYIFSFIKNNQVEEIIKNED